MSISISKNMTVNKIDTAGAARAFSARGQYPSMSNEIHRAPIDTYGRFVDYSTIRTDREGGTTCPTPIIDRQNILDRPQYSAYLNMSQGLDGGYDTMLPGYLSRKQAFQEAPMVSIEKTDDSNIKLARMMQTKFNKIDYYNNNGM